MIRVMGLVGMVRVRVWGWEKHDGNESPHKDSISVCVCGGGEEVTLKMVKYSCCSVCISSAVFLIVEQLWDLEIKFESIEDP